MKPAHLNNLVLKVLFYSSSIAAIVLGIAKDPRNKWYYFYWKTVWSETINTIGRQLWMKIEENNRTIFSNEKVWSKIIENLYELYECFGSKIFKILQKSI